MLSGDEFRRDLCRGLANTDVEHDNNVFWLKEVADLRNKAFTTSASLNKTVSAFSFVLLSFHH